MWTSIDRLSWGFRQACLLGVLLWTLFLGVDSAAQDAYFSLEGQFQDPNDVQNFLLHFDSNVPGTDPLTFRTWHYGGTPDPPFDAAGGGGGRRSGGTVDLGC
jgi:hypothetical protein